MGNLVPEARAAEADDDAGLIIPAEMQEDEETASDELQLGLQEDGTVVLLGEEGVVPVLRSELHICGHSWQPVLAQQEELIDTVEEDGTIVQSYQMDGQEAEGAVLEVRYKKSGNGLSITWRADVSEELKEKMGDNTRWLFYDPDEEPQAFPQLKSEMWSRTRSVYPIVAPNLSMHFASADFDWWNTGQQLNVKLDGPAREKLVEEGVTITLSPLEEEGPGKIFNDIEKELRDVSAYFEVMKYRRIELPGSEDELAELESRLEGLREEADLLQNSGADKTGDNTSFEGRDQLPELLSSAEELHADVRELLWAERDTIYEQSRTHNEQLDFAAGFSTNHTLPDELPKYALFGINTYRHAPTRLNKRDDVGDSFEDQMQAYSEILDETAEFGGEAMYIGGGGTAMDGPGDITWSQDFVPEIRDSFWKPNFNSRRIRDSWAEWAQRIAPVLKDADNIRIIQLGNEPFWHLSPYPQVGYNPPEVGCSTETWVDNLLEHYDSEEEWKDAVEDWKRDIRDDLPGFKLERFFTDGDPDSVVPWESLEEVSFDPENMTGYTFVDFLRERHGDLATLNEVWFGDDQERYFASWDEVFPPVPTESGEATESQSLGAVPDSWMAPDRTVRPREEDIPAYIDWKNMHGYYASDSHTEFKRYLNEAGVEQPLITTNAVMGHYINDFNFTASHSGCYPWITMDGLDAHGIDFYTTPYIQAYVASLRDADVNRDTPDRPAWIHETRWAGDRTKEGPHIAMYSFAHGIEGLVFFDHDRDFSPRDTVGLARLMDAMDDQKLQFESEPVTDGVALLYSLDSLWVADALTGAGRPYMVNFQSAATTLDRMQVLYSVYADRQLDDGVPENVSVLMAPGVNAITDTGFESIRSFVQNGGVLVTTPNFGAVDRYNRPRPDSERQWFKESDNVVIFEGEELDTWLENWQRGQYSMQRGLGWADKPLPDVAESLEEVIRENAPRTVRYLDSEGNMDARKTGARIAEDGTLYVFVDPWAEDVTIAVPGEYKEASNLYREPSVTLETRDEEVRVHVDSGPAIIRLDP